MASLVRSALIGLALQKPRSSGYSFELWTLERLQKAFEERYGVQLVRLNDLDLDGRGRVEVKAPAELVSRGRAARPRVRGKKGAIVQAYVAPPPGVCVICVDEMGPLAVKTYPGEEWKAGPQRATFEPDDGRRGPLWVHAAFEPATGQAPCVLSPRRDSAAHIQLLEQVSGAFPAERWLIIEDNLSIHTSRQTQPALAAWPEVQMQVIPQSACWLNLIEPWWKQLRSLALKGRRFERVDELAQALEGALAYWNAH